MQKTKEKMEKICKRDDIGILGNINWETQKKFPRFPEVSSQGDRIDTIQSTTVGWSEMNEKPP